MSSTAKKIAHLVLLILLGVILWLGYYYYHLFHAPLISEAPAQTIIVSPGTGVSTLAKKLSQRKMISHPELFVFYARFTGKSKKIRYGEYWIKPDMSATDLLNNIIANKGMVLRKITFVEGWTFRDIKNLLSQNVHLKHLTKGKTDKQIMTMLGYPKQHPEGRFFPDTYQSSWGNSDLDVLQQAYQKMQRFLAAQWQQRAKGLPYKNSYQALIVASLVEKETALKHERPIIAGVILRRLHKRMRLQVDPTVLYGLGKPYNTPITKSDLRSKTPYNTYQHYGLPPTPIDNPSGASIIAALHPKNGHNYLYYVSNGDGSHKFSATYHQHLRAVKSMKKERAKEIEIEKKKLNQSHLWQQPLMEIARFVVRAIYL